jgi:alpha-galactosidase
MPIEWREPSRQLHLHNGRLSHVMAVRENGALGHLHLGAPLSPGRDYDHLARGPFTGFDNRVGHPVALEVPTAGRGDDRVPALTVELADGSGVLDLAYAGHRILGGKPALPGLPATYVEDEGEADSLEVLLRDEPSGLEARLLTTIWRDRPAISRSLALHNGGDAPIVLTGVMSLVLDLPDADWHLLTLAGAWARERHVVDAPLVVGRHAVGSQRGTSSAQHNPFLALRRPSTTETTGEAIGLSLVYSGNWLGEAEVGAFGTTRLRIGIDPGTFRWRLEPGATFQAPEAVLAWSDEGLGGMSDAFHGLYRERLARGPWRDRPRPVLVNNWEGTYFDFDEERIAAMAASARELGIELFVLDDGWFGRRDDDTSSLGDWTVDERKLPSGLAALAGRVRALGMGFGIWIEPEMVSPRSRLFEAHPDWAVGVPGRSRTESRNQYVLDLSRPEVVDHLVTAITGVFDGVPLDYVKWDMNRTITEPFGGTLPPGRQGEFFHRFTLGVCELWRRLTEAFPDVLFESCASGGARFDPGILAFAPQGWTSDDTDAVERLRIQWGTSLAYPLSSMGAHVSAVPNHQVGRVTPLATRAATAFFGVFGYELDPLALSPAEREAVAAQVAFYRERRDLFQFGRFVRLRGPWDGDGNETAWAVVSPDRRHAIVGWYRVLSRPMPGPAVLRLAGLAPELRYEVSVWPPADDALVRANAGTRGGDDLEAAGLFLDDAPWEAQARGDFQARLFELRAGAGTRDG